jgi:hypothetical protein
VGGSEIVLNERMQVACVNPHLVVFHGGSSTSSQM